MGKKRQAEARTAVVDKEPGSYQKVLSEIKKISGFNAALPIRAKCAGHAVEYEFLVADDIKHCEAELMNMRLEAEGFGRR